VIKQSQSQGKTKQISTFREIRSMLGLLLFGSALFLAGARLCYNWAEEIPSMDPGGLWCNICKKVTYESDRKLLEDPEGDYWACAACETANLHTRSGAIRTMWLMIGLAVVLQVTGIVFYFFVAWINSQPNVTEDRE
jgi:hypothetical protein